MLSGRPGAVTSTCRGEKREGGRKQLCPGASTVARQEASPAQCLSLAESFLPTLPGRPSTAPATPGLARGVGGGECFQRLPRASRNGAHGVRWCTQAMTLPEIAAWPLGLCTWTQVPKVQVRAGLTWETSETKPALPCPPFVASAGDWPRGAPPAVSVAGGQLDQGAKRSLRATDIESPQIGHHEEAEDGDDADGGRRW